MFKLKQIRSAHDLTAKRHHSYQVQVIIGAIGVFIVSTGFYQVREFVAALLIFTVLFGTVGIVILILLLIQELTLEGLNRIEASVARIRERHTVPSTRPHRDLTLRSHRWN